jgi:methylthioribose-1-phosphate isomerase
VCMIDQRLLPGKLEIARFESAAEVAGAITDMVIRGAPAIGAAAAYGLALSAARSQATNLDALWSDIHEEAALLRQARPTAVNLGWALDRLLRIATSAGEAKRLSVADLQELLLAEAQRLADEDVAINQRMGAFGAELIAEGDTVIHHCNTGALAAVDHGTALGVIRSAFEQGKKLHVLVDETRPRLQGARLTAWELQQYGIPHDIISDNAAGYFLNSGKIAAVFVGADRVAANGDTANKIGTYMLALAANDNQVPFYVVAPTSTVDLELASGDLIPIEERDAAEVLNLSREGMPIAPEGSSARNPAFDITPHRLISAIVTEMGILRPPFVGTLKSAVEQAGPR